jgi:hypothetical protein
MMHIKSMKKDSSQNPSKENLANFQKSLSELKFSESRALENSLSFPQCSSDPIEKKSMCRTKLQEHKDILRNATVGNILTIKHIESGSYGRYEPLTNTISLCIPYDVYDSKTNMVSYHMRGKIHGISKKRIFKETLENIVLSELEHESLHQILALVIDIETSENLDNSICGFPLEIWRDKEQWFNKRYLAFKSPKEEEKSTFSGKDKNLGRNREEHNGKDVKELELSSIPSNGLEIASYGLTIPKMVIKNKTKVKTMVSKEKKQIAQVVEQKKIEKPQESVIDSKVNVEQKKKVRSMKQKKKEVKSKQRKGKSLLTAFRINRMEKRMTLDLNRGEIGHKYA